MHSEIDEGVNNLVDFTSEILVASCVQCMKIIRPEFDAPSALPEAMAARLRICTMLANTVLVCMYIFNATPLH